MLRRNFCFTAVGCALIGDAGGARQEAAWSHEWDRAVLDAALRNLESRYDPGERMLRVLVGGEYRYHTTVRNREVHPTRDSNEYALLLLEAGDEASWERAIGILDRLLDLQDVDPQSKWYGLWGYYLEEPPSQMAPADWNWADFHGALLLLIEHRHGDRLPANLRGRLRAAIGHAAASVRRRNVSMNYTNIAVQGTFVTLAAAKLLKDRQLGGYALDRLYRFARAVDESGSFAEYNSPTYMQVTLANFARMRMLLQGEAYFSLIERLERRAWLHLAMRWHPPTRQLAGPMSRCYRTDIGAPLWLQKALNNRLTWASLDEIRQGKVQASGEVAILPYRCPEDVVGRFLQLTAARQHREVFVMAEAPTRPIQGTTYLAPHYCLGSANRSDFWIQRRPLLAYWTGGPRTAGYVQLRLMKDEYDFASGLFYSVQEQNYLLALTCFMSPGGDKHPSLDPIRDGVFDARSLRLRWDISRKPVALYTNGRPREKWSGRLPFRSELIADLGGAKLYLQPRAAAFGNYAPFLELGVEGDIYTVSLYWFKLDAPTAVRWTEVGPAYALFTLAVTGPESTPAELRELGRTRFSARVDEQGSLLARWKTPVGELGLRGLAIPAALAEHNRGFVEMLNGKPVPLSRLSDERLASDSV